MGPPAPPRCRAPGPCVPEDTNEGFGEGVAACGSLPIVWWLLAGGRAQFGYQSKAELTVMWLPVGKGKRQSTSWPGSPSWLGSPFILARFPVLLCPGDI